MKPIATVINNNQPGWTNIIETEPNVTLPVGTRLYLAEPFAGLGAPLAGGFFGGEMTISGERYTLIVAPKAMGEKMATEYKLEDSDNFDGVDSDDDGIVNTVRINDANHPAAQFCRGFQSAGFDDWYLPSRDELMMLWRNLGPCRKATPELFREGSSEAFNTTWYWSSTEHAQLPDIAWIVDFSDGFQYYNIKDNPNGVRAVRRFKI